MTRTRHASRDRRKAAGEHCAGERIRNVKGARARPYSSVDKCVAEIMCLGHMRACDRIVERCVNNLFFSVGEHRRCLRQSMGKAMCAMMMMEMTTRYPIERINKEFMRYSMLKGHDQYVPDILFPAKHEADTSRYGESSASLVRAAVCLVEAKGSFSSLPSAKGACNMHGESARDRVAAVGPVAAKHAMMVWTALIKFRIESCMKMKHFMGATLTGDDIEGAIVYMRMIDGKIVSGEVFGQVGVCQ